MIKIKYDIDYIRELFNEKNYTLVSNQYKNIKEKLEFICDKHKDVGIQQVSLQSFLKNKCHCISCKKENLNNQKNTKRKNINYSHENFYKKHFNTYKQKLFDAVKDEYELLDVYLKNNRTYIKVKHVICGTIYDVSQYKFFYVKNRCQNKSCKFKRRSAIYIKPVSQLKKEVYDLVGNDYLLFGEYTGTNNKMLFQHNISTCNYKFLMTPHNFIQGKQRCPKCSSEIGRLKITKKPEQYKKEVYDLFNDEYKIIGDYINSSSKIKIKHNKCGHCFDIIAYKMLSNAYPCPFCNHPSKGEQRIICYLDNKFKNQYIYQKYYKDLVGINNGLLSYDFYIPSFNLLIEYQGEYHDGTVLCQTEEEFEKQKEHDRRKRNYARNNKINLLEIWYWDYNNIEKILDAEFLTMAS